jgi:membrane-associated phospholipid phosphatase
MEPILQWGLDVIMAVQSAASPPITAVMKAITFFGGSELIITLLVIVYWCVNEKKGFRLSVMVLLSMCINLSLKEMIGQPRPPSDLWLITERMSGFPSGHAQNTVVLYFILASFITEKFTQYKNRIYVCAALLCFLIGFSRIYLGVHYPTDVLGGWILGGIVLCGYFLLSGKLEALIVKGFDSEGNAHRAGMITSAAASLLLIAFYKISYSTGALISGALMLGLGLGYCLNRRHLGFKSAFAPGNKNYKKYLFLALRLFAGTAGLLLVFIGTGKLLPPESLSDLYNFIRLSLAGLWVSLAAPWVFVKLRIAEASLGNE